MLYYFNQYTVLFYDSYIVHTMQTLCCVYEFQAGNVSRFPKGRTIGECHAALSSAATTTAKEIRPKSYNTIIVRLIWCTKASAHKHKAHVTKTWSASEMRISRAPMYCSNLYVMCFHMVLFETMKPAYCHCPRLETNPGLTWYSKKWQKMSLSTLKIELWCSIY